MDAANDHSAQARLVPLLTRGGAMAALDLGRRDRPVDIVFSHANGFNAATYRSILQPLGADLRILAIDLRGHGASTLPTVIEGRDGWAEFRDDLLAFLSAATEGPVLLAGHSMGATSSLLAAALAPERVKGLVLFDPVLVTPDPLGGRSEEQPQIAASPLVQGALRRRATFPDKAAALAAYAGRGAFASWSAEQLAGYVEAGFRKTGDGQVTLTCTPQWEASNFRSHNYDPWTAFALTRCPIHILKAQTASTARIEGHEAELAATGRVTIETVPETTHFLPMERPDLVRATLRAMA